MTQCPTPVAKQAAYLHSGRDHSATDSELSSASSETQDFGCGDDDSLDFGSDSAMHERNRAGA